MVQVKFSVLFVLQVLAAAIALARPATQQTSGSSSPSLPHDQPQLPPKSPSTSPLPSHQLEQQAPSNPPLNWDPAAHKILQHATENLNLKTFLSSHPQTRNPTMEEIDYKMRMLDDISSRVRQAEQSNPHTASSDPLDMYRPYVFTPDHERISKEFQKKILESSLNISPSMENAKADGENLVTAHQAVQERDALARKWIYPPPSPPHP